MTNEFDESELSFESAMNKLEDISSYVQGKNVGLDDLVSSYKEACDLYKFCDKKIKDAKLQIDAINKDNEIVPFDDISNDDR